jgi:uncharacterized repeat protein (TIGR01451 family)
MDRNTFQNQAVKKMLRLAAAALLMTALCSLPAWAAISPSSGCPAEPGAPVQIEVLPLAAPLTGTTCGLRSSVTTYDGGCRVSSTYPNPEAIYKVWLHEGNSVGFTLKLNGADLALAMIQPCKNDSGACKRSSDKLSTSEEGLAESVYNPGVYYLSIDTRGSATPSCGEYVLTVTGENPVPDLKVTLTVVSVVGPKIKYKVDVANNGKLAANNVKVTLKLSKAVSGISGDCPTAGSTTKVTCNPFPGPLGIGSTFAKTISVSAPSGSLSATAAADADEGDQNPTNDHDTKTINVAALIDLSIESTASPAAFTPGRTLTYTLKVHNAGPSAATGVVVTDTLPAGVSFVSATGCRNASGTVTCDIPKIAAGATVERSIKVTLQASQAPATEASSLVNTVRVTAAEPDSGPGPNSATSTTRVIHKSPIAKPPRPQRPPG